MSEAPLADEAVAAAQRWLDLFVAGDVQALLEVSHPNVHPALLAGRMRASAEVRELARVGTWAWRARPYSPGREIVSLVDPAGVQLLTEEYLAGNRDQLIDVDGAMTFVMEHTAKGWLYCGQPKPKGRERL
jgi:hypothetical protein